VGSLNFMRLSSMKAHTRSCPELRTGNSGQNQSFPKTQENLFRKQLAGDLPLLDSMVASRMRVDRYANLPSCQPRSSR
jgi:hypothetical protein